MVRVRETMSGLCMSRALPRVRVPSPRSIQYTKSNSLIGPDEKKEFVKGVGEMSFNCYVSKPGDSEKGNRVMLVVDSSIEARGALQWALSHTVQAHEDTIVLFHVIKPPQPGGESGLENERATEVLRSLKNLCVDKRPGVNVEVAIQEGKDKGGVIVEAAKRLKVSLLVLGQRRRSILWKLRMIWTAENRARARVVDYCIQNANCMTIAVRRKSKKDGGYLITTKRHKNFWLLA
ncbi:hydrolase [Lithospermum erythrorhizon]|uniref:Hydrolase n=1 Tax=Lithospermum erythrorhizon TaxID=34254 RepID=A0AAV3NTX3_LITER